MRARVARVLVSAALALVAGGLAVAAVAPAASAATSASKLYVKGDGFGHGIGMSQYGAAGYAAHGAAYQQILAHYYTGTTIGNVGTSENVTVLLSTGAATFGGATTIAGSTKTLTAGKSYTVSASNGKLALKSAGSTIGTFSPPLTVSGPGTALTLSGKGTYDGSFVFTIASGRVQTVNNVPLEDYVEGVVPSEMPSGWPAQALEAQAVAARTYVLTTTVSKSFDAYSDDRSQVYGGVGVETAATNNAVAATTGQVVEYNGALAETPFFASSGGYTESDINVWGTNDPWLLGVSDPYDDYDNNPYFRWTRSFGSSAAAKDLRADFRGTLRGIRIVKRGVSPRIVQAQVVGSRGSRTITGSQLEAVLGTPSTYMVFSTLHDSISSTARIARVKRRLVRHRSYYVSGSVFPAQKGVKVVVERHVAGRWRTVHTGKLGKSGSFRAHVSGAGSYRVLYAGLAGPTVSVG
jgi:stage II sporulation protein D